MAKLAGKLIGVRNTSELQSPRYNLCACMNLNIKSVDSTFGNSHFIFLCMPLAIVVFMATCYGSTQSSTYLDNRGDTEIFVGGGTSPDFGLINYS